jgi:hypothetical protein
LVFLRLKYLNLFDADPGSGIRDEDSSDPGSGIRVGKKWIRDPVSGIRKKINILPLPSLNKANYCCYIVRKGYAVPGYFYVYAFYSTTYPNR